MKAMRENLEAETKSSSKKVAVASVTQQQYPMNILIVTALACFRVSAAVSRMAQVASVRFFNDRSSC